MADDWKAPEVKQKMERIESRPGILEVAFVRVGRGACGRLPVCPGLSRGQVAGL